MIKSSILLTLAVLCIHAAMAQNTIQQRIILIGDAGEKNTIQQSIIAHALQHTIDQKTTALFLGDNVYPKGVELSGEKKEATLAIFRSQFEALRQKNVPVYFISGNHDWDKSGPLGFQKIMAANTFIESLKDSLLQILPSGACPGPTEMPINDKVVLVAIDSEWWLFPFNNHIDKTECICKTKRDVLGRLSDIVERNRDKIIVFATHHPFYTYGPHGGYFTLKQHLFPLTELKPNLYIPLPGLGSLYPLLRNVFPPPEDTKNVLYRDMKKTIEGILKTHPNVIHVSGHEHTLQLIQGEVLQIVSGAGSRNTPVKKAKNSLFAEAKSGYVIADIMADNSINLEFFSIGANGLTSTFKYTKPYTQPSQLTDTDTEQKVSGDSIRLKLVPNLADVSGLHKALLGTNYRDVWATEVSLPVLHLSATSFKPTELGGGMQTRSLRLLDANKKEWVIRSIDKNPDALLPQALSQTLASDILKDNVSAIFPFAPLTVPVFANALGVAHSNPRIVYVAPDKKLGIYGRDFANTVVLLEEREPLGKSLSTIKMQAALKEDNDNSVNQYEFLKAKLQDVFLGDWDRHADQWRWVDKAKGKNKKFLPIPRDRDQVFYINEGLFPKILALPWIMPKFEGFKGKIRNINTFAFNSRLIDGLFTNNLSESDWQKATQQVTESFSDSVIVAALKKMPSEVYQLSSASLIDKLKQRRQALQISSLDYYRFLNKVIDITTSDKNEEIVIKDTLDGKLAVMIHKITKSDDLGKSLYHRILDPTVTKEINIYTHGGEDLVSIRNFASPIKIRVIGDAHSAKRYVIVGSDAFLRKIHVYDGLSNATFTGQSDDIHQHLSNEPNNTSLSVSDRYNQTIPLLNVGYNVDDGFLLGGGVKWVRTGFRKLPYASAQQFMFTHAFASSAFSVRYEGEWLETFGKADFVVAANIQVPITRNFFGLGGRSVLNQTGDFRNFYRTRFNLYDFSPTLRWRGQGLSHFSIGPVLQIYQLDADDNRGRFINNTNLLNSYDSNTIFDSKAHLGLRMNYVRDKRSNALFPTFGSYINIQLSGYSGLNAKSNAFGQVLVQLAGYKSIDRKSNLVVANRIGAGLSVGKPNFYQSMFLGGQDNLQGYNQFRFGGEHMLYNNLEVRLKVANVASYILPGQLGLVGFYDVGKVWQQGRNQNNRWHQGMGGGFYFAPAQMFVFQFVMGGSHEGWLPYFTARMRY
jgi:Omp85 superfamily domain/Calcineurin-like phosphoesterase